MDARFIAYNKNPDNNNTRQEKCSGVVSSRLAQMTVWDPASVKAVLRHAMNREWPPVLTALGSDTFPVHAVDRARCTILHAAAGSWPIDATDANPPLSCHLPTVLAALALGANPNARNRMGMTPMSIAVLHGSTEVVSALVGAGGSVRLGGFGAMPLLQTAMRDGARPGALARVATLLASPSLDGATAKEWDTMLGWAAHWEVQPGMLGVVEEEVGARVRCGCVPRLHCRAECTFFGTYARSRVVSCPLRSAVWKLVYQR